jgi:hypothetical protein
VDAVQGDEDPLSTFLVQCSAPLPTALLPLPSSALQKVAAGKEPSASAAAKRSGRLAAKPSVGLSMMEKVKFVLLKKSGISEGEGLPSATELQRYKDAYKKPLTLQFF